MPSRAALVSSAIGGMQRFRQSWISIMILKASIGLGQVVALLVLLVLSTVLPSPLYPDQKQDIPSNACPRPQLFQAWMGVQIVRLTVCWSVSCWVCVRAQIARRREGDEEEVRVGSPQPATHRSANPIYTSGNPLTVTHSSSSTSDITLTNTSQTHTPDTIYSSTLGSTLSLGPSSQGEKNQPGCTIPVTYPAIDAGNSSQARDLHDCTQSRGVTELLDRCATTMSNCLGVISLFLFLLGNILLFHPKPSSEQTCFHAAPVLWWGVMAVVGVGWFLFLQVFVIVVIVGVGGQAVLSLLRRIGPIPPQSIPGTPRPARPDPLSSAELHKLQIVCYVPHPEHEIAIDPPSILKMSKYDQSLLPYPAVYLDAHHSTCAMCQEHYTPPRSGRTILMKADPLKRLPCKHVFHAACIDQWLSRGAGNCPFCNASVRNGLSTVV